MKIQNNKILTSRYGVGRAGPQFNSQQQARAADFVNTSPMNKARAVHSATLLPNGKVLVAGKAGNSQRSYLIQQLRGGH